MNIKLDEIMNAVVKDRYDDLHVQINKENKEFLRRESDRLGVVMGLYLDKLLTVIRKKREG